MSDPKPEKKRISASEFAAAVRGPYRRLFGFLRPYRGRFFMGLLAGAIYGALGGLLIYAVDKVTAVVLPKDDPAGRGGTTVLESWHANRELPELKEALAAAPPADRDAAVQAYTKWREMLHDRSLSPLQEGQPDPMAALSLPPSLPAEFRLCLEGERILLSKPPEHTAAGSKTANLPAGEKAHLKEARARWQTMLELPADQRRHRTLWARYLLAHTETDNSKRSDQLIKLHEEAASGKFTDVLNLTDVAPKPAALSGVLLLCLILPGIMFIRAVVGYWNAYCLTWVSMRVLNDIRGKLFERIMGQSLEFFNKQKSGDLMQTILNQTRTAQETLSAVTGSIIKEPLSIISALVVLFYIDARFTMMAFILFPLCIVPVSIVGKKVRRLAAAEEREASRMAVIMQEALVGVREVKSYNRESYESARFQKANWNMLSNMMKWRKALEATGPAVEIMAALGIALALVYVWNENMSASKFISLNGGFLMLYQPAKALSRVPIMLYRCLAATTNIFELFDRPVSVKDAPDAKALSPVNGRLTFEDVTFDYHAEAPAVKHISLEIAPKQSVAFVGRSGAGKSTLFHLLLRLYDPQAGRILFDGHDIRDVTQASLRSQIGVVSQDVFLFHDTIYENIRYGRLDATEAEVHEAARRAHAHDFILAQSNSYQTIIGDKGSLLSGGQRQRISIARAILKNAPVLLLDEAMSALDTEAERHVQEAIADLAEGKTVLAIAHRLSTVINSDMIVVMDRGAISATGTHAELLEKSDIYRVLHAMQFGEG